MNKQTFFLLVTVAIGSYIQVWGQEFKKDTTFVQAKGNKVVKNRNVMLNASEANKPREVNIGLPASVGGTEIYEDGLPVSYYVWPHMPHKSWRGGNAYGVLKLLSLSESVLLTGNVGYTLYSESRLGNDVPKMDMSYTVNHFGTQKMDLNLSGKFRKGWYYSIGTYQNFEVGSNDLKAMKYTDRTEIYKAALTHRWNEGKGEISAFGKYAKCIIGGDGYGPFYYETDGSVTAMDGFDLGRDTYLPEDGEVQFVNIKNGKKITKGLYDGNLNQARELGLLANYQFDNGSKLSARLKYSYKNVNMMYYILAGLSYAKLENGYTYEDGSPFSGYVQIRNTPYQKATVRDMLGTIQLENQWGRHNVRLGLNQWFNKVKFFSMTSNFAHTVEANPRYLNFKGQRYWDFNTGSEYYDGQENKLAFYVSDDWQATRRLNLSYGLRLEYYHIDGKSPTNPTENDHYNDRTEGFFLGKEGVKMTNFNYNKVNPIATASANYTLWKNFGFTGNYLFNRQSVRLENFAGKDYANLKPVDVHLGRIGIYYNNKWLQLTSTFSYIRKTNFNSRILFTAHVNGVDESKIAAVNYDIATMGWTTDAVITPFEGFQLHYLLTWQKPQYKGFDATLSFSDNQPRSFSFNNKIVTGISHILMEIDPSYTLDNWRFWLSFRYFSKEYINKPNTLSFKSRWETFGGIDYRLNEHISFSANVVNFLNQKGANGAIGAADLVTDTSQYNHYLMAGGILRPFTAELTVKLNF